MGPRQTASWRRSRNGHHLTTQNHPAVILWWDMMGLCWGATLGSPQLGRMGFFHIQNVDENGQKSWSLTNKLVGSRWFTAKNTIHLQKPECNRHASTHVAYKDTYIYTVIRRYTKKKTTKTIRKRREGRKRKKRNREDLPRSWEQGGANTLVSLYTVCCYSGHKRHTSVPWASLAVVVESTQNYHLTVAVVGEGTHRPAPQKFLDHYGDQTPSWNMGPQKLWWNIST